MECVLCQQRYSEQDVLRYEYFVHTNICYICYLSMMSDPATCFGKKGPVRTWNPKAEACRSICPDRKVCPLFARGDMVIIRDLTAEARAGALKMLYPAVTKKSDRDRPFKKGSMMSHVFNRCCRGWTMTGLNAYVEEQGCSKARLLRVLRKEQFYGFTWSFIEDGGKLKVDFHAD